MKVLIQQKKNTYEVELFFELLTVKYGIFSTTFGWISSYASCKIIADDHCFRNG